MHTASRLLLYAPCHTARQQLAEVFAGALANLAITTVDGETSLLDRLEDLRPDLLVAMIDEALPSTDTLTAWRSRGGPRPLLLLHRQTLSAADRAMLIAAGANVSLTYPVHPDELAAYTRQLLTCKHEFDGLREAKQSLERVAEATHHSLTLSERRYQQLFDSMAESYCLCRVICDEALRPVDYAFIAVNPSFSRLAMEAGTNLTGRRLSAVWPKVATALLPRLEDVVSTGKPTAFDEYFPSLGRWLEVHAHSPSALEIGLMFIDVDARKRAEESARDLNSSLEQLVARRTYQLQVLLEFGQSLGKLTDTDEMLVHLLLAVGNIVPCDLTATLAVSPTECVLHATATAPLAAAVSAQVRQQLLASVALAETSPGTLTEYWPPLDQDGLAAPAWHYLVPIQAKEGKQLGSLYLGHRTPVELQIGQERAILAMCNLLAVYLERRQSVMAAEQRRLAGIIQALPLGLIVLDDKFVPQISNPLAAKLLNLPGQLDGLPALASIAGRPLSELLPVDGNLTCQHEIETEGPEPSVIQTIVSRVEVSHATPGWIIVLQDVTSAKQSQRHLGQQERLAAVGELAAGIAHDFNNSLTTIIGLSDLMIMRDKPEPRTADRLQMIADQGRKAAQLVQQILDFGRKSISDMQPLEMTAFLKQTVRLLKRTIPESIVINSQTDRDSYWVVGDGNQFGHALMNLAVNAAHAMPNGGNLNLWLSDIHLEAGQRPPYPELTPGDWLVLSVNDTGTGIPPAVLPHIFEPFFTTKERFRGTGLGLAQVYGLIRKHNGHIAVATTVGVGTTFRIYLPLLPGPPGTPRKERDSLVQTFSCDELTVLLVEDEKPVQEVVQTMLEEIGVQVITADNGRQALEVFAGFGHLINLVISDMTMPAMGGEELFRELRQRRPDLAIVLMTGYAMHGKQEELISSGAVEWLQKPLKFDDLTALIKKHLEDTRDRR